MAVAFSALGTQNTVTSGTTSVSHLHTIASAGNALIVAVHGDWNGNTNPSISASIGGTALTTIRQLNNWWTRSTVSGGFYESFAVFGIINPPTGAQTVTLTISNPGSLGTVLVQSASYTGVASFGTYTNNGVVGTALTVTSGSVATGDMCFNSFFSVRHNASAALSGYNRTSRHNVVGNAFGSIGFLLGDAAGAGSTIAFNATIAATAGYGFTVPMVASVEGTTTDITPAAATIVVTGTAPALVTTTVLTPAAATITVTGTAPKLENTVSPPGGSLTGALITITGSAPTLTMSLVTTGATITISGGTPSSAGEAILTPAAATIAVTGTAPTLLVSIVPGSETLPVTGGTPVLVSVTVLSPATAPISVTGGTPLVILPITLQPSSAAITVTGSNPTITVGIFVATTPDEDHLLLVRREHRILSLEGSRIHTMGRFKQVVDA